jgi:excisionase family DNA binding protein
MGGDDRLLYGVMESAEQLSISQKEVRRLIERGDLKAVRLGRRVLVPAQALADYVDHLVHAAAETRRR